MNAMAFIARNVRLTTNTKTCESRGTKKDALHEESILFMFIVLRLFPLCVREFLPLWSHVPVHYKNLFPGM